MKILEYSFGYLNLNQTNFFEIVIKKDNDKVISCWLETPGRDIFVFSCESEQDARKFRSIFWSKLKTFIHNDKENVLNLMAVIHDVVESFFKEEK